MMGLVVALMLLLVPAAALADSGPHGGYTATNTPDGCAGCHRAHTAKNDMLLVAADEHALCMTCHGSAAAGAQTNVTDGVYAGDTGDLGGEGRIGGGLLAGGFENALMNTDFSAAPASHEVSSAHRPDGTTGTVWGFGDFSATANEGTAGFAMECSNCHNPHGNSGPSGEATYRILRSSVVAPGPAATNPTPMPAFVPDQGTKVYTVATANENTAGNYFDQNYKATNGGSASIGVAVSGFCGACHSRHVSTSRTDTGDAVFTFRHTSGSSSINCMTCHVAHGTSAGASALSTSAGLSGGGALLRLDDRGVCANCHVSGSHWTSPLYPYVTAIAPNPVAAGAQITVGGKNFGTLGARVRFYTGTTSPSSANTLNFAAEVVAATNVDGTAVTCVVPASLVAGSYFVSVVPNGLRDGAGASSTRQSGTTTPVVTPGTPWVLTVTAP
ncbi:MAG: cytochrome c3 family protein [Thermoleophilia bacterium]